MAGWEGDRGKKGNGRGEGKGWGNAAEGKTGERTREGGGRVGEWGRREGEWDRGKY